MQPRLTQGWIIVTDTCTYYHSALQHRSVLVGPIDLSGSVLDVYLQDLKEPEESCLTRAKNKKNQGHESGRLAILETVN